MLSKRLLINTKNWENNLSKEDYFCIYASLGEYLFSQNINDNYDFIKEIENIAKNGRLRVKDTDRGKEILEKIEDLKQLLSAYRSGLIKEL